MGSLRRRDLRRIRRRYGSDFLNRGGDCTTFVYIAGCGFRWVWNRRRSGLDGFYRGNEPVSPPRQRFDKLRAIRGIVERLANFVNGGIQVVVDIHKRVGP